MKEVYERYGEHFIKLNPPTKKAFKSAAKSCAAWYKKFLPSDRNARILDIGCGMGHFLYFLKNEGYTNFWGIDISVQQVSVVKENITENVSVADVFDFLKENGLFHVIVANHVIEHIPKERLLEFLHLVFSSLQVGGIAFIKTANMSNPFGLRGRYMDVTHTIGFTEHSLFEVLNAAGFQNIHLMGAYQPVLSVKSAIGKVARVIVHRLLKLMFLVQGYPPPRILDKDIIVIAVKR